MSENTLGAIIDVETEIRQMLEQERRRAAHWLSRTKSAIKSDEDAALTDLHRLAEQSQEEARQEAQLQAAQIVRDAEEFARRVGNLEEEELARLLLEELRVLLPEPPP